MTSSYTYEKFVTYINTSTIILQIVVNEAPVPVPSCQGPVLLHIPDVDRSEKSVTCHILIFPHGAKSCRGDLRLLCQHRGCARDLGRVFGSDMKRRFVQGNRRFEGDVSSLRKHRFIVLLELNRRPSTIVEPYEVTRAHLGVGWLCALFVVGFSATPHIRLNSKGPVGGRESKRPVQEAWLLRRASHSQWLLTQSLYLIQKRMGMGTWATTTIL